MKSSRRRLTGIAGALICSIGMLGWMQNAGQGGPEPADPVLLKRGARVYNNTCATCHGKDGSGEGPVAANLMVKPRKFTEGMFKFRSTPSGKLPTDADLYRTISRGIHTTAMPLFKNLPADDRWAVVQYIKTFSPRFADPDEYPLNPMAIDNLVPYTPGSVARGKSLYDLMKCEKCHGENGKGDGPSSHDMTDAWGEPISPRDLTQPHESKMATSTADIYRTFTTGLDGTPMPSYAEALTDSERWDLANFVFALQNDDLYSVETHIDEAPEEGETP